MKQITAVILIMLTMILLAACGGSIDKEKSIAETNVKKAFQEKPKATNENVQSIQFHLPPEFTIKEELPNNIILQKGTHPYILFYNPNEEAGSKALYELIKEHEDEIVVNKTFSEEDRFGYLVIIKTANGQYEVTTGIGGIKGTTETTAKNVAADAELLMKIVASTVIKE